MRQNVLTVIVNKINESNQKLICKVAFQQIVADQKDSILRDMVVPGRYIIRWAAGSWGRWRK